MSFDDRNLCSTIFNDQALFFQGAFALHESGQLEDETYHAYLRWFAAQIVTPGGRAWWESVGRPIFTARMVGEVDARIRQDDLPDLLEIFQLDDAPPSGCQST